jgi:hypothetical protein
VSLLEPFIDTVVICTMTALVIVISGVLVVDPATGLYVVENGRVATAGGVRGAADLGAFAQGLSWFPYVLAVAVVLFAFSTMISWSYYGLKAWTYMFGEGHGTGAELQAAVLRLRGHRRGGTARRGDRLLRRDDLRDGGGQHHRALRPAADREARGGFLFRAARFGRDPQVRGARARPRSDAGFRGRRAPPLPFRRRARGRPCGA